MRRIAIVLVLAACGQRQPAASDRSCQADSDCELETAAPPGCCSACAPTAVSQRQATDDRATCERVAKDQPDYFQRCPHLDCPCERGTARCDHGTCTVDVKPCN
jgi:hypothetical protein